MKKLYNFRLPIELINEVDEVADNRTEYIISSLQQSLHSNKETSLQPSLQEPLQSSLHPSLHFEELNEKISHLELKMDKIVNTFEKTRKPYNNNLTKGLI